MKRQLRGFTLLEVLIAIAVFASAAIALVNAANNQLSHIPLLRVQALAGYVASNRLVDAQLEQAFPELGTKSGRTELGGTEWYWRQEVVKAADERLRLIRVNVSLSQSFESINAEVETYVAKPD